MASKNVNWLSVVAEFIRLHPKISASLAFELGAIAAQAANKVVGRRRMTDIPSRLIELAPSMADLGGYLPMINRAKKLNSPKRRKKNAPKQNLRKKS